jgi:hypothetical protein
LTSRHFLAWAIERGIELVHIQPGKPTQNGRLESCNGKLREECLRVSWFQNLFDARRKIAAWRKEYNEERPHSSLGYRTPKEFAELSRGKDAGCARLENAGGVSHFPTAPAAANFVWLNVWRMGAGHTLGRKPFAVVPPVIYSRSAIFSAASFDVITECTSKSTRSLQFAIQSSSRARSSVSIS